MGRVAKAGRGTPWLLFAHLSRKTGRPEALRALSPKERLPVGASIVAYGRRPSARSSLPKRGNRKLNGYPFGVDYLRCGKPARHVSSQQTFSRRQADERKFFRSRRMRHRRLAPRRGQNATDSVTAHQELPWACKSKSSRDAICTVVLCRQEKIWTPPSAELRKKLQRGRKMAPVRAQRRYAQGRSRSKKKIPDQPKVRVVGTLRKRLDAHVQRKLERPRRFLIFHHERMEPHAQTTFDAQPALIWLAEKERGPGTRWSRGPVSPATSQNGRDRPAITDVSGEIATGAGPRTETRFKAFSGQRSRFRGR